MNFTKALLAAAALACATGANAETLRFTSFLDASQEFVAQDGGFVNANIDSAATGIGTVIVDTVAQTVSTQLDVTGITLSGLFDNLVDAPVGPVHLHSGVAGVNGPIVVPFAFNPAVYGSTADGFSLNLAPTSFAELAATSGTSFTFEQFVEALSSEGLYFNVHTDAFTGGEIRGQVAPVPLPAGAVLLLTALGGMGVVARRRKTAA